MFCFFKKIKSYQIEVRSQWVKSWSRLIKNIFLFEFMEARSKYLMIQYEFSLNQNMRKWNMYIIWKIKKIFVWTPCNVLLYIHNFVLLEKVLRLGSKTGMLLRKPVAFLLIRFCLRTWLWLGCKTISESLYFNSAIKIT